MMMEMMTVPRIHCNDVGKNAFISDLFLNRRGELKLEADESRRRGDVPDWLRARGRRRGSIRHPESRIRRVAFLARLARLPRLIRSRRPSWTLTTTQGAICPFVDGAETRKAANLELAPLASTADFARVESQECARD